MEKYNDRKYIIGGIILVVGIIFLVKLFMIQIIDSDYKLSAETNTRRIEIIYPSRGLIYDRNGKLIAHNQPSYDLKIAPYELEEFDTAKLCEILGIDVSTLKAGIRKVKVKASERHNPFIKLISPETFGKFKEQQYKFPGFYFTTRTLRKYEYELASHVLGYVGEVDSSIMLYDDYYELHDYYGVNGIENTYEKYLRGKKGRIYKLIDVHGREKGSYKEGKYDIQAESGKDIITTLDIDLQQYGEKLMQNFKGSIVAIEPSSGEVLCMVSAPTYNPSLLIGRDRKANYKMLKRDTLKPLFNNSIMALYPPGSTFKLVNALIGKQTGVINTNTYIGCNYGFRSGRLRVKCHAHKSPLELIGSIQNSCNAYYCHVFKRILEDPNFDNVTEAYQNWRSIVQSFGFAMQLNIDLPYEKSGFIPPSTYYDKYYGEHRWRALTIISMAIGQGEVLATPLQLANMAAGIANKGYYYTPHVVKRVVGVDTLTNAFETPNFIKVDSSHFQPVIEGMKRAVNVPGGTALIAKMNDIVICGKTGTAQNPHGDDHSVFIAFAPEKEPKIAISVFVEHGVWGARYAAPISSLMIEKYLTDSIANNRKWLEQRMMKGNLNKE